MIKKRDISRELSDNAIIELRKLPSSIILKKRLSAIRRAGRCRDCGRYHGVYMLKKVVWLKAVPDYYERKKKLGSDPQLNRWCLCLGCVERRLGRLLEVSDFIDAPSNDLLFHFTRSWLLRVVEL